MAAFQSGDISQLSKPASDRSMDLGVTSIPTLASNEYVPLARIGSGGQAEILLAVHYGGSGFEKVVVIKRLWPHLAGDESSRQSLVREARLVAQLRHPNVCQVLNLLEDDAGPMLVLEYLDGISMLEVTRLLPAERSREDVRFLVTALQQAAEGLHHAHNLRLPSGASAGLVHRDVSSNNLIVAREGILKVIDFGIATDSADSSSLSKIRGTVAFMSPEQTRGGELTAQSDVFSLGVVAYESLTGEGLFRAETVQECIELVTSREAPSVVDKQPYVNEAIEAAVRKALSKRRSQRYQTARDFGEALAAGISSLGGPMSLAEMAAYVQQRFAQGLAERSGRVAELASQSQIVEGAQSAGWRTDTFYSLPELDLTVATDLAPVHTEAGEDALPFPEAAAPSPAGKQRPSVWRLWPLAVVTAVAAAFGASLLLGSGGGGRLGAVVESSSAGERAPERQVRALSIAAHEGPARATPPAEPESPLSRRVRKRPARGHKPPATRRARGAKEPGFFSLDSRPFCKVKVDGKGLGWAPVFRHPLRPGTHRVVATLPDGRSKSFAIVVEPGEVARKRLRW